MDNARIVEEFDFFDEERKGHVRFYMLPALESPLKEIMFPEILTDVDHRNYRINREATDHSFQEIISTDQDSKITRIDDNVDDRRKKKVADDDDSVPVHYHPRFSAVNAAVDSSSTGDDRDKKRAEVKGKGKIEMYQESQVGDDGFNKEKMRENVNSSERNSINHAVSRQEQQSTAVNVPPPVFHTRIRQAIQLQGGAEQPVFLFQKKLDLGDVCCCFNRLYLSTYSQLLRGLTRVERIKLYNRLMKNTAASLRVVTTDPKGVDYEMLLHTNGVYVLANEWISLVTANGLQQGDTVQGWGYCLGDEFRLALIFQRAT